MGIWSFGPYRRQPLPYIADISRSNPSCFLFLVDQSGSMKAPFAGQADKSKAPGVADAINRLLQNLVIKCAKAEGLRDYFHVGLIGYGSRVGPAFGGTLANQPLVPLSAMAHKPLRVEMRARLVKNAGGDLAEHQFKFPLWFEPTSEGKTPMCQALALAKETIDQFVKRYRAPYPPLVMNITDGRATDGCSGCRLLLVCHGLSTFAG